MHQNYADPRLRHDLGLPSGSTITEAHRKQWRESGHELMAQTTWNTHARLRAERGIQTAPGLEGFHLSAEEYDKPKVGTFAPSPAPVGETPEEKAVRVRREEVEHFNATVRREAGLDAKAGVALSHDEYRKWRAKQPWAPIGSRAR
jgi:hypothetical protein